MDYFFWAILAFIGYYVILNRSPIPETSEKVHKITSAAEFDALASSTTNVVVDCYADWCPPCRAIAPIYSKLADQHASKGHLAFAKVNVDHARDLAGRFNVTSMPTFLVIRNGEPKGVAVEGLKGRRSVGFSGDGLVERVLGADKVALEAVVQALAEK
ncbi:thioredoxin [Coniochaeta ligniaria NRRL 30616]|uniref:Thioredoxin n=1 Tax=Coniochaeta ligniaria NRRL 30616 TaxID=1408157 RepID=A0A1J7IPV4_9PEZI|nr:thioredoxin [Coniochaeta ligniaria NRRL 30616]